MVFRVARVRDQPESVAQPLNAGAGGKYAAFQGVGRPAVQAIGDRRQKPAFRLHRRLAGIEHGEAAGAIGALDHAWRQAGLAERGRLLVARHAADRHLGAEQVALGDPEIGAAVPDLGQDRPGDVQQPEQVVVPILGMDVEQHGAGGVGGVGGVDAAAGEAPQQEAVDGAEGEVAPLGGVARASDVVEEPSDLGGREIGVDDQPRLLAHQILVPPGGQPPARIGGAAILPDDGVVDRPAAGAVPQDRGLALVGDPDAGDVAGADALLRERAAADRHRGAPDFLRIVLDPAVPGIDLVEFPPRLGAHAAVGVEYDRPGAGGALIDGEKIRRAHHVQFAPNSLWLGTSSVTPRARFHDVWERIASQDNTIC